MKKFYSLLAFIFIAQIVVAQCEGVSGNITPNNAEICQGQSVVLTATGGSSYEWRLNDVVIPGETGNTYSATQGGTYSVIIIEGECNVPASNTSSVTVNPTPTGTISPSNASICQGGEVTLTATGGNSYTWFRNGVEINNENNETIDVDEPGTYSVIIHQGDCSAAASNTAVITLSAGPTGTISPANASICEGSEVTLTATGGSSYTWFRNGNEINGQDDETIDVDEPGTYSVIIHQGGCSGAASNTSVVTLSSTPTGTISPANAAICAGGSTVLTATGGTSYTWFRNGTEIIGQDDATLTVTQAGTYTVTIHQGACNGAASNNSVVTLSTAPTGTISPANAAICTGGSTVLTATGGTSYTWFLNGTEIIGQDDATLTVTQAGTYSVTIHQGDCSGEASNTSVVTLSSAPTGTISPANAAICAGGSTILTATGGSSYTWFRNGTEINGQDNATLTVTQAGTYSVTIHQGDCSGAASNSSVVTASSTPSGTISPASSSICPGGSQVLTATGGSSYIWFLNGVEINGETDATLTVTQAGLYSATIQQGNCEGPAANTALVTLVPIPVGTISPATGSICEGGALTLTATGGTSYTWFRNGDEIAGQTEATLNVTTPGTYFAIIRQGTCSGPALNTSLITQSAAPTGTISPATGSICQGSSLVLTATGGTTYTWFRNGIAIIGESAATLNVTQAGTYTATIRQGNCSGPAANSSVITVSSAPTGTISPATGTICEGASTILTATGGTTYAWFRNGAVIAGQTGATLNVTEAGTYTATISQGDCSGPASNSAVITATAAPTGTISPASAALCGGGSQLLTATGGTSYSWLRDGEVISGEQSATITVTEPGIYSVIINNGTCTGPSSNTATITSENSGGTRYPDVTARPNVPVQLSAREIGVTYAWSPATDLSNPSAPSPTVTTNTNREYVITITTASGCIITDSVLVKIKSTIFVPTAFTPDGNGTNDLLRPRGEISSLTYFKVFNRWGQLMFETKEIGVGWDGKFKGADQPSDTYTWLMSGVGTDDQPLKLSGKTLLIR